MKIKMIAGTTERDGVCLFEVGKKEKLYTGLYFTKACMQFSDFLHKKDFDS